jgi:hypothetical protein
MKRLFLAATLLLSAPALRAQTVVTNDPGAVYSEWFMPALGSGFVQTFVATGSLLSRITVWHYFGSELEYEGVGLGEARASGVVLAPGVGLGGNGTYWDDPTHLYTRVLPASVSGRTDIVFGSPIALSIGATYSIGMISDLCIIGPPSCQGNPGRGYGNFFEVSMGNSFDGGMLFGAVSGPVIAENPKIYAIPDADLRFELEYVDVPEGDVSLLLFAALVGCAARSRGRTRFS